MNSTYSNLSGTMAASFRISKNGPKIIPGLSDPNQSSIPGNLGDIYIQYSTSSPQVFVSLGPSGWQSLSQNQTFNRVIVSVATFTVTNAHNYLGIAYTGGPCMILLPSGKTDKQFIIKDETGSCSASRPITLVAYSGQTIDGQPQRSLTTPYAATNLVFGGEWHLF